MPDRPALRLGVTGHRVLADRDRLAAGVDEALDRIERTHPARPLTVLSSLADGADRLVARLALERRGARLVVPLPMPVAAYRETFEDDSSRREFHDLLDRADEVVEVGGDDSGAARGEAYAAAGEHVVDRSDVLLAVWDGQVEQGRGGTGHVVSLARKRAIPLAWVHAGNRGPGTMEPTSLGEEQGTVTYENFLHGDVPYRIRVGLLGGDGPGTGVTDPEALARHVEEHLDDAFRGLFDPESRRILASARHTQIAYTVWSPLSTPAQRACARGLRRLPGARIEPVLPEPTEEYLQRFSPDGDRREVRELIEGARRVEIVRDEELGRYLSERCDVLVVLSPRLGEPGGEGSISKLQEDGEEHGEAHDRGGAVSEILHHAFQKRRPVIRIQTDPPVAHSVVEGHGLDARWLDPLDEFNAHELPDAELAARAGRYFSRVFDTPEGRELPETGRELVRERLLPYYVRASRLAAASQRLYRRAGQLVWVLFPLAIAAVVVAVLRPVWAVPAYAVELALLVAIAWLVGVADRRRSHQRWVECRFLAERLRSAMFLAACGVEATPLEAPPYTGLQRQRERWVLMAFDEIWSRLPTMPGCDRQDCEAVLRFVRERWIGEQIRFHRNKYESTGRWNHRLERLGRIAFRLAILAAAGHLVLSLVGHHTHWLLEDVLTSMALILPAAGAAMGGFRTHREYSRLSKRSRNMARALRELDGRVADAQTPDDVARTLREVEEVMVGEVQDWLMLMRASRVEAPG